MPEDAVAGAERDDFERLMRPVWTGGTVFAESVTPIEAAPLPLLFEPVEILAVQSARRTVTYRRDRDWVLTGGQLHLTATSRVSGFSHADLYPAEPAAGEAFPRRGGGYVRFAEGHFFHDRQLAVSYRHAMGPWHGPLPDRALKRLPRVAERLATAGGFRLVVFGDSISVGANASGIMGAPPGQPAWPGLLAEQLRRSHPAEVELINASAGGRDARWGLEVAADQVGARQPDLVIIAFGMNDTVPGAEFRDRIARLMGVIRGVAKATEFILIATSLPNPEVELPARFQGEYADALASLADVGTAVADLSALHRYLLTRKRFIDLSGNNVNHPNDFFHRLHGQYLSVMLGADG